MDLRNLLNKKYITGAMLLLLMLFGIGYSISRYLSASSSVEASSSLSLPCGTIVMKEVQDRLILSGQLSYHEKVNIASKVEGRLEKVLVRDGDVVRRGQVVARIERLPLELQRRQQESSLDIRKTSLRLANTELEEAERQVAIHIAGIEKARAQLADQKSQWQNMARLLKNREELYRAGGLSHSDLSSFRTEVTTSETRYRLAEKELAIQETGYRDADLQQAGFTMPQNDRERRARLIALHTRSAHARVEAAESEVAQARQALRATDLLLAETVIRSPLNGKVASRAMDTGEMVRADSIILTLVALDPLVCRIDVNEKEISRVAEGQRVVLRIDAFPDEEIESSIHRITPVIDEKSRSVSVRASLANPAGKFLPGMFARVTLHTGEGRTLPMLPLGAVASREGDRGHVFIPVEGGVVRQAVRLGSEDADYIEITDGIDADTRVVTGGVQSLKPDMSITCQGNK